MLEPKSRRHGGTATDLIVGVPLVAMLGVVAVKTFTDAEINTKVSQVRADMQQVAAALEVYNTDWGVYPFDGYNALNFVKYNYWYLPVDLSTPVAYLDSVAVVDPFREVSDGQPEYFGYIRYRNTESTWGTHFAAMQSHEPSTPAQWYNAMLDDVGEWMLLSVGPDGYWGPSASSQEGLFPGGADSWETPSGYPDHSQPYDPTNGTNSWGDIVHTQINEWGYVNVESTTTVRDWEEF